eukprot:TRINITY_DN751_c0_g1_i2.p1 TRINITY_DN751_c0_g1~~TRINITY_DN751_c0_g1_i2.p1  ORF type:complete len:289 (+),score=44.20 TRINITY_DN751_c0_g1_i2:554-1420(+)
MFLAYYPPFDESYTTLPDNWCEKIRDTKIMTIDGYTFSDLPANFIFKAVSLAKANNVKIFFDPGPLFQPHVTRQDVISIVQQTDVLLLTLEEARKHFPWLCSEENVDKAAHILLTSSAFPFLDTIVIKHGEFGAALYTHHHKSSHQHHHHHHHHYNPGQRRNLNQDLIFQEGPRRDTDSIWSRSFIQTISQSGQSEVVKVFIPAFPTIPKDTTGAGDSFASGIIFSYLNNWTLHEAGILANAIGSVTVSKMGAGPNVATFEETLGKLQSHPQGDPIAQNLKRVVSQSQ